MAKEFCDRLVLDDGTRVGIRPITPEDAPMEAQFVRLLSPETRRLRFLHALKELTPGLLHRLTHPDPEHETALIATVEESGREREIAVARYARIEGTDRAEFAIVVADEWQGRGIATRLMEDLLEIARQRGFAEVIGLTLADNRRMLEFIATLGFDQQPCPDDPTLVELRKSLKGDP